MKYADIDFVRHHREDSEQSGAGSAATDGPTPSLELDPPALPEALDFRVAAAVVARIDARGVPQPIALLQARRAACGLAAGQVLEMRCSGGEDSGPWKAFARISSLTLSVLPDSTPDGLLLQFRRA